MGKRTQKKARSAARRRRRRIRNILVVLAVAGLTAAAFMALQPRSADPANPSRLAPEVSKGPQDATVTITEYGDFNCPSCRQYHQLGIINRVLSQYPDDVRFVWRHFPVITPSSPELAEASECAREQGAFWEFHDLLFAAAPTTPGQMVPFAGQLGLDLEEFSGCYDGRGYRQAVEDQMREAFAHGFRGTPSFIVNDTPMAGPPSYELLIATIENYLN